VTALRTHTWTRVGHEEVKAKFGVTAAQLGDWLALTGDTSDNVPGCPGVGPKRATELLVKYGSLAGIYRKIKALHVGHGNGGVPYIETMTAPAKEIATPKVIEALWANEAQVLRARQLVTLRTDAPIRFEDIYERREAPSDEGDDMPNEDVPISPGPGPEFPPAASGNPVTPIRPAAPEVAATVEAPAQSQTALVVAGGVTYERALEPMSSAAALKLGAVLYDSRLYSRFPSAAAITAVIMRGREMGMGALSSLDSFHVIEGKPAPHAYLIIARAKADPDCEYFQCVESSATSATWETKNRCNPKPTKVTYTIEQARLAGLLEKAKGNWNTRPEEMLVKTAGAILARREYPAAAMGLYAVEEMGEAA
jgi:hypothetical protein